MQNIKNLSDIGLYVDSQRSALSYDEYNEMLKKNFPYYEQDINLHSFLNPDLNYSEVEIRSYQAKLRDQVIDRFEGTCPISNIKELGRLETAHIKPVNKCINDKEKMDVNNCILMWMDLHKYFDSYRFSINPDTYIVEIHPDCGEEWINQFGGKKVINLNESNKLYLRFHYKNFKKLT